MKTEKIVIKNISKILEYWLPYKIKVHTIPGLAIGIVHGGKLVYSQGFGHSNLLTKKVPTNRTVYQIASISKVFTATAIMQLKESGKINLDDKVVKYLSWFKGHSKDSNASDITIRQILSHNSGIFRDGDSEHWESGIFPNNLRDSFTRDAMSLESLETFKYSNYGFSVLGLIIEKTSGLSYEKYIKKNILKKLNLKDTYCDYDNKIKNLAVGYSRYVPWEKTTTIKPHKTNAFTPATGLFSSVRDLAKFISQFTLDKSLGGKILNRESVKEMIHPSQRIRDYEDYGLGMSIVEIKGRKCVGHGGGFQGYTTYALIDPKTTWGVVGLSNSTRNVSPDIVEGILNTIFECLDNSENLHTPYTKYTKYEGVYSNSWGDDVIVAVGRNLYSFDVTLTAPLKFSDKLTPRHKDTFILETKSGFSSPGEEVVFSDFRNGKARKVKFGATPSYRRS